MLVLSPSSTCDVCLEPYRLEGENADDLRLPCAIECGHVFCYGCINNLGRLSCPLCRSYYDPRSVRRLHVDMQIGPDRAPVDYHNPDSTNELGLIHGPSSEAVEKAEKVVGVDEGKRHLTAQLVSLVRQGAEGPEFQAILKQTKEWLRERPDEHWDLRALYLLLIRYQEMHKEHQDAQLKLHELKRDYHGSQGESVQLRKEKDEWKERAEMEQMVAQHQIKKLESTLEEQKQTALAVERTLREHHDRMDEEWSKKYQCALKEIRSFKDQIRLLTFNGPHGVQGHHSAVSEHNYPSIDQVAFPSADRHLDRTRQIKASSDDHFSPLAVHLSPYPVIMKGFSPLFKAHEADSSDPEGENDEEEKESYESEKGCEHEQSRMAADGETPEDGTLANPDGSSERRSDPSPPHMTHRSITKPGAIPIPHSNLTRFYDAQAQSQSGVTSHSPSQSLSHSHSPGSNPSSHSTSQSHWNSHRDYPIPSLTHSNSSSSTISSTILTPDCTGSGPVPGVGATGAAPSSLPHPNPASYFLKRHEKQRERDYSTLPRHYSTSSSGPPPSILSSSTTNASTAHPRQSKLKPVPAPTPSPSSSPEPQFAEVVDSGDEGGRINHRRQVLDDLLTDPVRPINLPVSPASIPAATITTGEFAYEKDVQVHVVNPARETRRESGRTSSRVQGQTDRDHTRDRDREREKEQRQHRPQPTPSPVPAPIVADPVPTPSVQGQPRVSHASEAAQALERERERRRRETQSQNVNGAPAIAPLVTPLRETPGSRTSTQQEGGSYFPQPSNMASRNGTSRGANFNESQTPASGYNQQPGEMSREYSHESRNTYEGEYLEPSRSKRPQREQLERKSSGRERERERDGREHRRREERDREKARDRDRDRDYDRERDRERALTGGGLTRRTAAAVGEA